MTDLAAVVADAIVVPIEGGLRVVDPDGLVRSVPVLDELAARGISVIAWSDAVESRLEWARVDSDAMRVVVVDRPERAQQLPADVLAAALTQIDVGVADLFIGLAPAVIRDLEWSDRAGAYGVKRDHAATLDPEATASLLLRALHQLDPETMSQAPTLLAGLLRLHRIIRATQVSASLVRAFARRVGEPLPGIATADALRDRSRFLAWLAETWTRAATDPQALDERTLLLSEGPAQLLDDYLDDGLLEPVAMESAVSGLPFGVGGSSLGARAARVSRELAWIHDRLDAGGVSYQEWREIAGRWADVLALHFQDADSLTGDMAAGRNRINEAFRAWLDAHYPELSSLPSIPSPAMVHRTAHAMESRLGTGPQALVVVDGLSLAAWRALLPLIRRPDWRLGESTAFAWIPDDHVDLEAGDFRWTTTARLRAVNWHDCPRTRALEDVVGRFPKVGRA